MLRKGKQGLDEIYVVGCGPSLKNFNWSLLKNKTTIAVNGAVRDVPKPDFFITGDSNYAVKHIKSPFWNKANYNVLVMRDDHKSYRNVKPFITLYDWVIPPYGFDGDIGFTEDKFHTGQNSGFCGLQLAVILGAKKIHLLGMDLTINESGFHYHHYYPNLDTSRLDEFLSNFVMAVKILNYNGIEVVSHSEISRLNEYVQYKELK